MSLYTTPLQFGYILALAMAILLWVRGWQEERLSDTLLGWVMFLLAQEIQDYTFGFAGINFLWNEMNGFPRGTILLFSPTVYFYLKSQVNRQFRFTKNHLIHLIPWFIFFVRDMSFFVQGKYAVQAYQESPWNEYIGHLHFVVMVSSFGYYFYKSIKLYKSYRKWSVNQFSDTEIISFKWFRNMVYFMIAGVVFKVTTIIIDYFYDLTFYQDWWWNLGIVIIIFYVGIWGYSQPQPARINFKSSEIDDEENLIKQSKNSTTPILSDKSIQLKKKLEVLMQEQQPYLDTDLTLSKLAKLLTTNSSEVSAVINQHFGKNFNDFVNEYRIAAFKENIEKDANQKYTLLAIALDCGFNSKATFNRAFKKFTGVSPRDYLQQKT